MQRPPVLITAGGMNSRFFPLNHSSHKGGIRLHGATLLERTLRNLKKNDFQEVVIIISPRDQESEVIKHIVESCNQELQLDVKYAVQPEALGLGDALLHGLSQLNNQRPGQLAVLSPYHVTAGDLLSKMQSMGEMVLCTSTTSTPSHYGIASFTQDGKMNGVVEKPVKGTAPSNEKVVSLYLLSAHFIEAIKKTPTEEYAFEATLDLCLKDEPVTTLHLEKPLATLKYAWDLFEFQTQFFQTLTSYRDETALIATTAVIDESHGAVQIETGAQIGHCARVVGPTYIGKNALVGDFSLIRQSSLEEGVVIGAHSEISRSIFLQKSNIHRGYVGDSIIGAETTLAAGFITANKRFDRESIQVEIKGKRVDSERRGFGAVIGEKTKVGTNVSTMPGKLIGSGCTIFPSQTIEHNIADQTTFPSNEETESSN